MRTRSGIALRFLLVASLMLGIVAMHQLPMSHGSPGDRGHVVGQHDAGAGQHGAVDHRAEPDLHSGPDLRVAADPATAPQTVEHAAVLDADRGPDHAMMLHLCQAILAAGFVLLALWWPGTRWPGHHWSAAWGPFRTASRAPVRPRPPPWAQPSVLRLRVLRL